MASVKVDTSVPLPPVLRGSRKFKYPFDDLPEPENGKPPPSIFIPNKTVSAIQSAAARYMKSPKGQGRVLTVRHRVEDGVEGVRVWRTK